MFKHGFTPTFTATYLLPNPYPTPTYLPSNPYQINL